MNGPSDASEREKERSEEAGRWGKREQKKRAFSETFCLFAAGFAENVEAFLFPETNGQRWGRGGTLPSFLLPPFLRKNTSRSAFVLSAHVRLRRRISCFSRETRTALWHHSAAVNLISTWIAIENFRLRFLRMFYRPARTRGLIQLLRVAAIAAAPRRIEAKSPVLCPR